MSLFDAFRYDGKRALVVGGASGMGAAVAELVQDAGAEVTVMDFADVKLAGAKAIHVNLGEQSSIDDALEEFGTTPIDALFSSAGVADGTPGIEKINYIGHRYMIDKFLASGVLTRGSSIGFISSAAGLGWEANLDGAQRVPRHHRLRRGGDAGRRSTARPTTSTASRRSARTSRVRR